MNEFDNVTTIQDECALLGAPHVMKSNVNYLQNIIQRIKQNYDSTEFDGTAFLADIALAKENCDSITEAADVCKAILEKLHNELTAK